MKSPFPASGTTDRRRGMTVVEACLLVAIVVLVGVIAVPALFRNKQRRQAAQCAERLEALSTACKEYAAANGKWPSSQGVLVPALLPAPLVCPAGGVYTLGTPEGDPPTCSVPGHAL
ncbi:MAG: type II secretion system protein [Kiritimatiellae bacterium]|nr:type II secretion system protein [Kiritimatiellia bacterium]